MFLAGSWEEVDGVMQVESYGSSGRVHVDDCHAGLDGQDEYDITDVGGESIRTCWSIHPFCSLARMVCYMLPSPEQRCMCPMDCKEIMLEERPALGAQ